MCRECYRLNLDFNKLNSGVQIRKREYKNEPWYLKKRGVYVEGKTTDRKRQTSEGVDSEEVQSGQNDKPKGVIVQYAKLDIEKYQQMIQKFQPVLKHDPNQPKINYFAPIQNNEQDLPVLRRNHTQVGTFISQNKLDRQE